MMLIEQTTVPPAVLPLTSFKAHLRLGTGFADDGSEDVLLEALLRAAMAAIEARTGKVLLRRSYTWSLAAWRDPGRQTLPVAPVSAITALRLRDRNGGTTPVAASAYRLLPDTHGPSLAPAGSLLPTIPSGGSAEIDFEAGFGADWEAVPSDLGHAVLLLAAYYHEHRQETALGDGVMPFGVMALVEPWRRLRLTAGGAT